MQAQACSPNGQRICNKLCQSHCIIYFDWGEFDGLHVERKCLANARAMTSLFVGAREGWRA
jgi:hypothetical protein